MTPGLTKARQLILSITTPADAQGKIDEFEKLNADERAKALDDFYTTAPTKSAAGETKTISIMLRVLEHFGDTSHDRMLLHYVAQAAANNALKELESETHPNHKDMVRALELISEAFADANQVNEEQEKS